MENKCVRVFCQEIYQIMYSLPLGVFLSMRQSHHEVMTIVDSCMTGKDYPDEKDRPALEKLLSFLEELSISKD